MSRQPYARFIIQRNTEKQLAIFSPGTRPGGEVTFLSFDSRVDQVCNINGQPFQTSPLTIQARAEGQRFPAETTVRINDNAPLHDALFYLNRTQFLFQVGIDERGDDNTYLGVHAENRIHAAQRVKAEIEETVIIVIQIREPWPEPLLLGIEKDGHDHRGYFEIPPDEPVVTFPLLVEGNYYRFILEHEGDETSRYPGQSGGTEQGDLVIHPPSGT